MIKEIVYKMFKKKCKDLFALECMLHIKALNIHTKGSSTAQSTITILGPHSTTQSHEFHGKELVGN